MKKLKTGSDFSGIGAFDEVCKRVFGEENIENVFACDMDKYARQSYLVNYKEPGYFPTDVYEREIPSESLDIYMTSPPCQGFSIAGKRGGSILFFNSHEFIQANKPRFFIFENVKGLLSHEKNKNNKDQEIGATFQNWLRFLGGKSINGAPTIFADENAVPYHIYWKVLNSKEHNVPQNRERVFIVGIRDDQDNDFSWPQIEPLNLRLKDVLENNVPRKYFLSEKMVDYLMNLSDNFNGGKVNLKNESYIASCLNASSGSLDISDNIICVGNTNPSGKGMNGNVYDSSGISPTLSTNKGEGIKVITIEHRGHLDKDPVFSESGIVPTLRAESHGHETKVCISKVVCFGRSELEKKRRRDYFRKHGKDSGSFQDRELILKDQDHYDTILANPNPQKEGLLFDGYEIRRLTPRECLRLQDFPDTFKVVVSDSQVYKQAGNSITVRVLEKILMKLKPMLTQCN